METGGLSQDFVQYTAARSDQIKVVDHRTEQTTAHTFLSRSFSVVLFSPRCRLEGFLSGFMAFSVLRETGADRRLPWAEPQGDCL